MVSAGNFFTAILLARALMPSDYGAYALLYALMLFMVSLHAALIVYGLSLRGAAGTENELGFLTGRSMVLTAGLGSVLATVAGAVAGVISQLSTVPWTFLALVFWLLQETTRRALMARLRHRAAVWGDAVSYLGQAICIAYLFARHELTINSAFALMAVTSAAGLLVQTFQLRLTLTHFRGAFRLVGNFWGLGRWALLANVAQAFIGQALLWFLAFGGMVRVASFQSVLNLLRVTNPIMLAVGSVLLPTVAARQGERTAGLRAARRYGLIGSALLLPYFGVIFVAPAFMLRLLYGAQSVYTGLGLELRVLVLGSALAYVGHVLGAYYYGLARSDLVMRCQAVAAATTLVVGWVMAVDFGVLGAAIAYDLTFVVQTAAFAWMLRPGRPGCDREPRVLGSA
jgi:O-antigen/teichoic acid export membrane protein